LSNGNSFVERGALRWIEFPSLGLGLEHNFLKIQLLFLVARQGKTNDIFFLIGEFA